VRETSESAAFILSESRNLPAGYCDSEAPLAWAEWDLVPVIKEMETWREPYRRFAEQGYGRTEKPARRTHIPLSPGLIPGGAKALEKQRRTVPSETGRSVLPQFQQSRVLEQ